MPTRKFRVRLFSILSIITWLLLLFINLVIGFQNEHHLNLGVPPIASNILLTALILELWTLFRHKISKAESINFIDLLWQIFISGLLTTIVSLVIKFFFSILDARGITINVLLENILYHMNFGLILAFLISTFTVWKRLILYQKSKLLIQFWTLFEYSLLAGLIFDLFNFEPLSSYFNIFLVFLLLQATVLSVNLRWVAYLNFAQKWKSILFVVLAGIYLWYFWSRLWDFSASEGIIFDFLNSLFIWSMFGFIMIYSVISVLVILFNLPTTSVFEKKLKEAMDFQRLSQSIPMGQTENEVYEILLDSAMSAVYADAAYLETVGDLNGRIVKDIDEQTLTDIKSAIENSKSKRILNPDITSNKNLQKFTVNLKKLPYKSAMVLPLQVKNDKIGEITLLKEVDDGFNREMINIINTFVNQASISIENYRLLQEALKNERYQEELKIASNVQKNLLPGALINNHCFDISAFSYTADEVGGDYYDIFKINDHRYALIIGDVSGKGTSAAFHMSQVKGIFMSLTQLDLDPVTFLVYANNAISSSLDSASFVTASFFIIDTYKQKIEYSRAGHCPTGYYFSKENNFKFLTGEGMGLGIIRNIRFSNYVEQEEIKYSPGDIMLLFTDGITEAINGNKAQYGYDRLKEIVLGNAHSSPNLIQKAIVDDLYNFCGNDSLNDDYTLMTIKFI